jgi:hypothetical protein
MSDLLDAAVAAHGGWGEMESLAASPKLRPRVSIGGRLWTMKGKGRSLDNIMVELDCHRQYVVYTPFISSEQRSVYTPSRTAIETTDGKTVGSCDNPCAVLHSKGMFARCSGTTYTSSISAVIRCGCI